MASPDALNRAAAALATWPDDQPLAQLVPLVAEAIDDAVAAEREACALAVEDTDVVRMGRGYMECDDAQGTLKAARDAIRARGQK